ncbi:MAG TPA: AMP-binding protein [Steroidobacteraceae bacterium]|nr:AMP-binding protein [Steroidobacteraceae bacterium]
MSTASFVQGLDQEPLRYQTIGQALDATAAAWGSKDALIVRHQRIRWTYSELLERVDSLAAGLLRLGLLPGDRIGIWAPNCAEWVLTQFASAKAGLILVNLNPAYRSSELEFALNKVGCKALVLVERFKTGNFLETLRTLAPELDCCAPGALSSPRLPRLRWVILLGAARSAGALGFDEVLQGGSREETARLAALAQELQPDQAVNIQFTSGTTGSPKGATLSHFNILNNGFFVGRALQLAAGDRMCIPVPLYHCFGMVMGNLGCMTHGAAMVFPAEWFDALLTLEAVQAERCTVLYGVPTMFIAELDHPEFARFDLASLRTGIMAGAPCPIEIMKRVITEMHMSQVTIAYGMTETSPVSFQSSTDDSLERRVSTVGRVHPHLQVKIVDRQGRVVPRGETGELLTRGYSVMKGYWDDAERTCEAIDEAAWMHTGDLAVLDEEGYCTITGRLKDMLIRGGENVYPREIEEFLYRHPKVQAVQVFGVPDPKYGEEVCAWVMLKAGVSATDEELRDFCRGRIAHHKVPRYVRFVTEFPMTVTGKAQKFIMRETMCSILALDKEPPPVGP